MGFLASARRFSAQAAAHNTAVYGGTDANGTANAQGLNLQLATGKKIRAAFVKFRDRRDLEQHGFIQDCHAAVTLPDTLGLSFALGDEILFLPDGKTYEVVEIGRRNATHTDRRYGLRRLET